jgi:ribosome-associated translation inhibitor RaiA
MKIQINTDANIHGTETLAAEVSASVEQALGHFKEHITRVEVHLSDESKGKSGAHDQLCVLEARLEGQQPVVVTNHAETLEQALDGAAQKLVHLLESKLGRLHEHRKKTPDLPLQEIEPEEL